MKDLAELPKQRIAATTFQIAYTKSKTLGNCDEGSRFFTSLFPTPWFDFSRAKGPANFDRPQRLAVTFVQELPNKFSHGFAKHALNNCSLNGFFIVQSGTPITVIATAVRAPGGIATNLTGAFFSNVVTGQPLLHPSAGTKENLNSYINATAWAEAPRGTFGNSGRGMLRGPGQANLKFSIFKDFKARERITTQFRTEFFNLLNHAQFGNPANSMDAANFGQISSTSVNARLVQFALKVSF